MGILECKSLFNSTWCSVTFLRILCVDLCYHFIHAVHTEGWTVLRCPYQNLASCISVREKVLSHLAMYSVQPVNHRLEEMTFCGVSSLLLKMFLCLQLAICVLDFISFLSVSSAPFLLFLLFSSWLLSFFPSSCVIILHVAIFPKNLLLRKIVISMILWIITRLERNMWILSVRCGKTFTHIKIKAHINSESQPHQKRWGLVFCFLDSDVVFCSFKKLFLKTF